MRTLNEKIKEWMHHFSNKAVLLGVINSLNSSIAVFCFFVFKCHSHPLKMSKQGSQLIAINCMRAITVLRTICYFRAVKKES